MKTILVSGTSSGIGYEICIQALKLEYKVISVSRNSKPLENIKGIDCYSVDITDNDQLNELVEDLKSKNIRIDFLINNAGAAWGAPYDQFPESGWDKVVDLNLKSPFFLTQQLTSLLEKKGTSDNPSRVVNIASIDGLHVPFMETYSYTASKSGIIHLTRHLAKTLVSKNIIVNAIAPGPFDSHMLGKAVNFDYSLIADSVPRKRIGTPEDIAGLCIYLCSRAGAYTVGETITCDGGSIKTL